MFMKHKNNRAIREWFGFFTFITTILIIIKTLKHNNNKKRFQRRNRTKAA